MLHTLCRPVPIKQLILFGDNPFYEPGHNKRRKALNRWIKKSTSTIQKAVSEELESLVDFITRDRWTDEGWKHGEEKLRRIQPDYHLVMDIKLRKLDGHESYKGELPASFFIKPKKSLKQVAKSSDSDDDYYEDKGDRTPNEDRSDSMNPNNDAYQASMDNRSDQINPNNPAYWSSRGR